MAADPIAAAEQLAGSTYAGAQERTAAGKKALLDGLAANGTYQNTIDGAAVQASAPAGPTALPGAAANMLPQMAPQVQQMQQAAMAAAAALGAHQRAQQQQASSTYFDQVGAAIPIEQSRSQSEARQIMQELIDAREARAAAAANAKIQLQIQQEQLAGAREARAAAATKATQGKALTPSERLAVQQAAYEGVIPDAFYSGPNGSLGRRGEAFKALATNPNQDPNKVFAQYPEMTQTEQQQVLDLLNGYYGTLAQTPGYYTDPAQIPHFETAEDKKAAGYKEYGAGMLSKVRHGGGF